MFRWKSIKIKASTIHIFIIIDVKCQKKDDRMIAEYFKYLEKYQKNLERKLLLLWQCGGFYEIYSLKR